MFGRCVLQSESNCDHGPPLMAGVGDGECVWDKAGCSGNGNGGSVGKGCVEHRHLGSKEIFSTAQDCTLESAFSENKTTLKNH